AGGPTPTSLPPPRVCCPGRSRRLGWTRGWQPPPKTRRGTRRSSRRWRRPLATSARTSARRAWGAPPTPPGGGGGGAAAEDEAGERPMVAAMAEALGYVGEDVGSPILVLDTQPRRGVWGPIL